MSIDRMFNQVIDILGVTHTRDAAAGMVPSYTPKYSNIAARHEESTLAFTPPAEIGGAPTLIEGHKFFLFDPGPVNTGDIVLDEEGFMLRITDSPNRRRAIGHMPEFLVLTSRETQGGNIQATFVLFDQNGNAVRDQAGEVVMT